MSLYCPVVLSADGADGEMSIYCPVVLSAGGADGEMSLYCPVVLSAGSADGEMSLYCPVVLSAGGADGEMSLYCPVVLSADGAAAWGPWREELSISGRNKVFRYTSVYVCKYKSKGQDIQVKRSEQLSSCSFSSACPS